MSKQDREISLPGRAFLDALRNACGPEHVVVEPSDIEFYSQDVYVRGATLGAVVQPCSVNEVVAIMRAANKAGAPVYLRGGGMSYTNAYLAEAEGAVLIDMARLNSIREINVEDGYVTVEAGCTWKVLDDALAQEGVRATFWGPFSGKRATVGGSMSQGTATFGSGQAGSSASAALGFEFVTGEGKIVRTGMDAQSERQPFFRNYGPDLTGLLTSDAGALGVKTAVSLALEKRPRAVGGISMAFKSFDAAADALREAASTGLASEIIAMDAELSGIQAGEASLKEDLKKLAAVVKSAPNPARGIFRGAKAALAGRRVYTEAAYTAHFIADAVNNKLLDAKVDELRRAAAPYGDEIPNAAIGVIRAEPFPDLPLTHFDGRRMLPIHGLIPNSKIKAFHSRYCAYVDSVQQRMEEAKVTIVYTFSMLGRNVFLYEPVWYWEDEIDTFHERMSPTAILENMQRFPPNPKGRALVEEMRVASVDLMQEFGAGHLQIGRAYPYMRDRDMANIELLRAIKKQIDPNNVLNQGALGL